MLQPHMQANTSVYFAALSLSDFRRRCTDKETCALQNGPPQSRTMVICGRETGRAWHDRHQGRGNVTGLAIELRDVRKQFGATRTLEGVDLQVPQGAVFGFLGP